MRRLKAKAISTAMTFFWAVQAFAAEPKTEKIEVTLDIPPNPFLDQLCVVANYLTIGAIVCSFVFGGIWLMQKKDSSEYEDEDEDEESVVQAVESTKTIESSATTDKSEPAKIELKEETVLVEEVPPQEMKIEEKPAIETSAEDVKSEETSEETSEKASEEISEKKEKAPAATKSKKAGSSETPKKPRKSKKKE